MTQSESVVENGLDFISEVRNCLTVPFAMVVPEPLHIALRCCSFTNVPLWGVDWKQKQTAPCASGKLAQCRARSGA
jgi:hypothetical protein